MRYIYGPVNSRRLGSSLGISLTPYKICDFDCVYCQLGKTSQKTIERKEYISIDEVYNELLSWFQNNPQKAKELQYITISGSGEPTLNIGIGELIARIKKLTPIPVCVITNSSLLTEARVRQELLAADLIIPSLDAVEPSVFEEIDRPLAEIKVEQVIEGLIALGKEFQGKIWLEVMLVKGMNDDYRHMERLKEAIDKIKPDKIQLNSPVRTTAQENVLAVDTKKMEKIKEILGDRCEIL